MELTHKQIIMLSVLKKKLKKELKNNEYYDKLKKRKVEIFNYIEAIKIGKNDGNLLNQYDKIGEQIKEIEIEKAFKVNLENRKNMKIRSLLRCNGKGENNYYEEFNKIVEDSNYKTKIEKRKTLFLKLSKRSKKYQDLMYELESIETQIATIETELIKRYTDDLNQM